MSVRLWSEDEGATIDGQDQAQFLVATGAHIELNRMHIQNMRSYGIEFGSSGAFSLKDSHFRANSSTFRNNEVVSGAGGCFFCAGGTMVLANSHIIQAEGSRGAGIYLVGGAHVSLIENSTIVDCLAYQQGAALYVSPSTSVSLVAAHILRCTSRNEADDNYGGGAYVNGGAISLSEGSTIADCVADIGGALFMVDGGSAVLASGSSITRCSAARTAGGVLVRDSIFRMSNAVLSTCTAQQGGGGAMTIDTNGHAILEHSAIEDCTSAVHGSIAHFDTDQGQGTLIATYASFRCQPLTQRPVPILHRARHSLCSLPQNEIRRPAPAQATRLSTHVFGRGR